MHGFIDNIFLEGADRDCLYLIEEYQQILTTIKWDAGRIPSELIEKFRRSLGCVAIGRSKSGELVPFSPAFGGDIDIDGIGLDVSGNTLNGEYITGRRGEDIAIIWNNSLYYPDLPFLKWYAKMFGEVDKSIRANLLMSRLFPIALVGDEQSKKSVEKAYEKLLKGDDLYAIAKVNKLLDDEGFNITDITQVGNVDKIQYLSKLYDDLMRRLYVRYGVPMSNSNGKMAQTNEKELAGYEFYSQIYLNDNLEMAQRGCEEVNKIFGTEWSVELSKPFNKAKESVLEESEEEATEEVTETAEEAQEGADNE